MKKIIEAEILEFVHSEQNLLPEIRHPFFMEPLVGYAAANDVLFSSYKEIIGEFHLTPQEFFEAEFGEGSFKDGSVISWILPLNPMTIEGNREQQRFPTKEWAHTRYFGEQFNEKLRAHMVSFLMNNGCRAVAPALSDKWERLNDERVGYASSWSERHAAFACGLGTFSLNDGLITAKGIAHRCGSIVTDLKLEPTARPYQGPYDYCLYCTSEKCGACIKRCPAGAITAEGHDKELCSHYCRTEVFPVYNKKYGVGISGCGLCQTRVPCENKIP